MGNLWKCPSDSSSASSSSTRPSSPEIAQNTSNEGTHSGTGSAFSTRLDEDCPNGQILTTPNLTFTSAELETATRNFWPDTVLGEGPFFKQILVVEVDMHDAKSKSKAMKIAVGLPGVVSAAIDAQNNQLTVVGCGLDSVHLITLLRERMSSKIERLFCMSSIVSSELVSVRHASG